VTGEVQLRLPAQVLWLHPTRRVAVVGLKSVGPGPSYAGQYAGGAGMIAPVVDGDPFSRGRRLGRGFKVDPVAGGGAELSMVVGDDEKWQRLAAGAARVEAVVAFASSLAGDPVDGRPVRIEIG
jgi:hypothetical protein